MELDPFWVRPVEFAAVYALKEGRRTEAYLQVELLRPVNPGAALEVEMMLAYEEGDLSRAIKLGRKQGNIQVVSATTAKMDLAKSLIELGYVREAALIADWPRFERQAHLRKLPDHATILAENRPFVGIREELFYLWPLMVELARSERYADLVALFDRRGSAIRWLASIEEGNRDSRAKRAAFFASALAKSGRNREAAQLFRAADEGIRVMIARGKVPPISSRNRREPGRHGRKQEELGLLEEAVARGWFA